MKKPVKRAARRKRKATSDKKPASTLALIKNRGVFGPNSINVMLESGYPYPVDDYALKYET